MRQALGKLPPDLPQTYIRILEIIDSNYSGKTLKYIQRLLKWILLSERGNVIYSFLNSDFDHQPLSIEVLCEAICIEDEYVWPTEEGFPKKDQILRWLGCLVRVDHDTNELQFAHFSVEEFLRMDPGALSHSVARNYLVHPEDKIYLLNTCLTYVMHSHFNNVSCTSWMDVKALFLEHPFYAYIGSGLIDHIMNAETAEKDCGSSLSKFLATPPCCGFKLWAACQTYLSEHPRHLPKSLILNLPSPLHFASATGLISQSARLLEEGASPDVTRPFEGGCVTPLHLAISGGYRDLIRIKGNTLRLLNFSKKSRIPDCRLALTKMLVDFGADINRQVVIRVRETSGPDRLDGNVVATPLILALLRYNWKVASLLLNAEVDWDARAQIDLQENQTDLCSFKRYLDFRPVQEDKIQHFIERSDHRGLKEAFAEWRYQRHPRDNDSQRTSKLEESAKDVQDLFIDAFTNGRWEEVRDLVTQHESLDLNCLNEQGFGAVHYASVLIGETLSMLLGLRADPNLVTNKGKTALALASKGGCIENIRALLEKGSNLESRDSRSWTPLLLAVNANQQQAVQVLLDAGADITAKTDAGEGALYFALQSDNTGANVVDTLLRRGIECFTSDNFGTTPLHKACSLGLKEQVEQMLALSQNIVQDIDVESLFYGTCLYTASEEGFTSIIKILLRHGATVNKVGPGNLLGSALMAACADGHTEAVEILLANGAALEVEGSRFNSASGTARAFRQEGILRLLEEHAAGIKDAKAEDPGDGGQSYGLGEFNGESTDSDEDVKDLPLTNVSDTSATQAESLSHSPNRQASLETTLPFRSDY